MIPIWGSVQPHNVYKALGVLKVCNRRELILLRHEKEERKTGFSEKSGTVLVIYIFHVIQPSQLSGKVGNSIPILHTGKLSLRGTQFFRALFSSPMFEGPHSLLD